MAWPHAGLTPEGEAIPDMADPSCGTEEAPFQAVLVFSDPIDWYRDLQLITDVIMSGWRNMSRCLSHPQGLIRGFGVCTISIVVAWCGELALGLALQAGVQVLGFSLCTSIFTV